MIRHNPAAILPAAVFIGRGNVEVAGTLSNRASTPMFAAVSPKRVSGPGEKERGVILAAAKMMLRKTSSLQWL